MAAKTKSKRNNAADAPQFHAILWNADISPRKARLVMNRIQGLPVSEALDQLRNMKQKAAVMADKLLKSAIANADQAIELEVIKTSKGDVLEPQPNVDIDDLYVHDALADDGPRLKRWRPRARGAAYPYRKYYSHLTIRLRPAPGK